MISVDVDVGLAVVALAAVDQSTDSVVVGRFLVVATSAAEFCLVQLIETVLDAVAVELWL